jgi:hypothetical protein
MTQLSVMELAKQGDPHAIAALINRSLESKGIYAKAELEADCLKVSLQAAQVPNQKAVVTIIHRGMIVLQIEKIKHVKILTYRSDNNYLAWQHEFDLGDDFKQSESTQKIAKSADVVQDQNINLVSNPTGVILVQKMSQIQQNLQEYQDIIVRFTDEQVGTVRCLTTLTELIQVISQPSFLFAAVASNPNLRSLLDTIAESSKTDEHGDQVITNLSILQPGQQWQKAKIRLVTKIFLEPAEPPQEQNSAEVPHQGITLDLAEIEPEPIVYETPAPNLDTPISKSHQGASNLVSDLETITADSLFEGSPELDLPSSQAITDAIESSDSITANSLFDDFSESTLPTSESVRVVDDITASSDFSDSLFDDFMNVDSSNSYREDLSVHQVEEDPQSANTDDDLFDSFSPRDRASDRSLKLDITESNIDTIKSKIPKQDLDKLLQLMDEEEETKAKSEAIKSKDIGTNVVQPDADFGATTIERILGNMETISLNVLESKSSSDFVTLDDLSEDLNSVGF